MFSSKYVFYVNLIQCFRRTYINIIKLTLLSLTLPKTDISTKNSRSFFVRILLYYIIICKIVKRRQSHYQQQQTHGELLRMFVKGSSEPTTLGLISPRNQQCVETKSWIPTSGNPLYYLWIPGGLLPSHLPPPLRGYSSRLAHVSSLNQTDTTPFFSLILYNLTMTRRAHLPST